MLSDDLPVSDASGRYLNIRRKRICIVYVI